MVHVMQIYVLSVTPKIKFQKYTHIHVYPKVLRTESPQFSIVSRTISLEKDRKKYKLNPRTYPFIGQILCRYSYTKTENSMTVFTIGKKLA